MSQIGKLTLSSCYLSGAIDACPNLGVAWREWLSEELWQRYQVIPFNPMEKPIVIAGEHEKRGLRKQWKETGEYTKLAEFVREIRHVDLRLVDKADFGIFYFDMDIPMAGTYEELFWMNRSKKPCLIMCKQGKRVLPDWIFGTIPSVNMFSSWEDLFVYLDAVNTGLMDDLGRWLFFDLSKYVRSV